MLGSNPYIFRRTIIVEFFIIRIFLDHAFVRPASFGDIYEAVEVPVYES